MITDRLIEHVKRLSLGEGWEAKCRGIDPEKSRYPEPSNVESLAIGSLVSEKIKSVKKSRAKNFP